VTFWSAMPQTLPAAADRQHTAMPDLTGLLRSVRPADTFC
jgi:hypothetical protein